MIKCETNNHEDTKYSKEGGGEVAQGTRTDSPAACGEDKGEQIAPLQPMEDHSGVVSTLKPVEDPMLEQVYMP